MVRLDCQFEQSQRQKPRLTCFPNVISSVPRYIRTGSSVGSPRDSVDRTHRKSERMEAADCHAKPLALPKGNPGSLCVLTSEEPKSPGPSLCAVDNKLQMLPFLQEWKYLTPKAPSYKDKPVVTDPLQLLHFSPSKPTWLTTWIIFSCIITFAQTYS
jgi:hypothetical protein